MVNFEIEKNFKGVIIGLDEVGRGPLAGPVISCGCYFKNYDCVKDNINFINDSKKISIKKRIRAFNFLKNLKNENVLDYKLGMASVEEIDKINILNATKLSMTRAIKKVILSYAISRFQFGTINTTSKSLFLEEINHFFIHKVSKQYVQAETKKLINTPKLGHRKLTRIKPSNNDNYIKGLKIGQNISHNIFGKGEIKNIDNTNGNQKITVLFIDHGTKILLTKFAKIKILT